MRNQRGITLIALIITIIVMIVLSAVTISFTLGENGIFSGMRTGKYMNKVQALDDSIKAYTLKSNNAYSSSKKSLEDLVTEGILKKITLTGDDSASEDDDKYLYYVNFENADISVAETLGLKAKEYENEEKLTTFKYKDLSELQDKGIYVVDVDLNAAYLKNNRTYGKLSNFGGAEKKTNTSEFESQVLKLAINPKEKSQAHEVVLVVDRTVSMARCNDPTDPAVSGIIDEAEDIPILYDSNGNIDYTAGYQQTRWAAAVNAMDQFMDSYFGNSTNNDRKVTIKTFYGENSSGLQTLGTFTNKEDAKKSYSNIFSESQYTELVSTLVQQYNYYGRDDSVRRMYNINYDSYFRKDWNRNNYQINCRLTNGNEYRSIYSGNIPSLGNATCTPNALEDAYEYVKQKSNSEIPMDVIVLTDGESNRGWGIYGGYDRWSQKYYVESNPECIQTSSKKILNTTIAEHQTGVYAVGFGTDATKFVNNFGENLTKGYTASNASSLIEAFKSIAESIKTNQDAITDADNSHSILTRDTTTGELKQLEIANVNKIIVELENTETGEKKTMTFQKNGNGTGGIYNLDAIYNKDNKQITLENAWVYSGLTTTELTMKYNKSVIVYTD